MSPNTKIHRDHGMVGYIYLLVAMIPLMGNFKPRIIFFVAV